MVALIDEEEKNVGALSESEEVVIETVIVSIR